VREVQKAVGELPPEALNLPDRVDGGPGRGRDADQPPLRFPTGSVAVKEIRSRTAEPAGRAETWAASAEIVDGTSTA
jgi:hypothetical protein